MSIEALKQALAKIKAAQMCHPRAVLTLAMEAEEIIEQAIAEAEKQEPVAKAMTAERALYFMERFKHEEKLLGPNEQAAVDFVISMLEAPPQRQPLTDELPCCGYTDATAIKWNDFNHAVQCHNCGHTYAKSPNTPLTLDYIDQHIGADEGDREAVVALVREVEAAHGIKGEA